MTAPATRVATRPNRQISVLGGMRLCVVAHSAFPTLAGEPKGHVGGVERQTSLLARWLAARGYGVSVLTWDEGQPDDLVIDGVRVTKICRRNAGLRGLRFFHPRWTGLVRAMREADADVYYHNCGEYVTGQVALWCRRNGRAFVYSVASDPDCDPRLPEMKTLRERALYRHGLRSANRVIVQTRTQKHMLRSRFGIESLVIPMPCAEPADGEWVRPAAPAPESVRVAWVGRIGTVKRLEWLLDIAEALPEYSFDVAGAPDETTPYSQALLARAAAIRNVAMHGRVNPGDMPRIYRAAACLCCTSVFEGFPNTFLEAWSHGVPVVSSFDPDHLIAERHLGAVAHDVPGLILALRSLLGSPERWKQASANVRRYYLENHTIEAAMPQFEAVFLDALKHPPRGAAAPGNPRPATEPTRLVTPQSGADTGSPE